MEKRKLCAVTVDGRTKKYPYGTTYEAIAADHQAAYDSDILLVLRNGKLRELHKPLRRDCSLTFLTARDKPGAQTYERSAIFLFLKAFHDTVGAGRVDHLSVDHSVGQALFIRASGEFTICEAFLRRVQTRMEELVARALPIEKRDMDLDDAIAYFRANGMEDKAEAMRCRLGSTVNVYELDGYVDYFYGYMAPNTRYIRHFELLPAQPGAMYLLLPAQSDPNRLGERPVSGAVFRAQYEATLHAERLGFTGVGALNDWISRDRARELILMQEALMEKQIADIARQIAARPDVRFVMIAGPSSSGKTTFSHRLATQLFACGLTPHAVATDNYFKNREDTPRDEDGQYDFECLEAMDVEAFNHDMLRLLDGETVELPRFNFKSGSREYAGDTLTLGAGDVLVIEGIHCLNDALSYALPAERKFRVYISCLTTLNIDSHNRIPSTDARLLRRITRDARTRGTSAAGTIAMWPSVRRGEEKHIYPYQGGADAVFNSALLYEFSMLRPYIEPLLYAIRPDDPTYLEARRLLKFLSYFLPIPSDAVPPTSIAREFIGGGCCQT